MIATPRTLIPRCQHYELDAARKPKVPIGELSETSCVNNLSRPEKQPPEMDVRLAYCIVHPTLQARVQETRVGTPAAHRHAPRHTHPHSGKLWYALLPVILPPLNSLYRGHIAHNLNVTSFSYSSALRSIGNARSRRRIRRSHISHQPQTFLAIYISIEMQHADDVEYHYDRVHAQYPD